MFVKGLVYHAAGDVRFDNLKDPQSSEKTDVVVRMKLCSIYGSDLHIYHGGLAPSRPMFGLTLGAERVYALDLVVERRGLAREMGAISLDPATALETVRDATAGRLLDCAVEVAGAPVTTALAIDLVGKSGTVSVIGAGLESFTYPIKACYYKSITFRASICSVQRNLPELVPLVQQGELRPEGVISHRMRLADGAEAYRKFDRREGGALKIVMAP
jgi:threonine dehydrogenase-like Zn-dependent dehydrogenase